MDSPYKRLSFVRRRSVGFRTPVTPLEPPETPVPEFGVTSVTGTFGDTQSVTVAGAGFGTHASISSIEYLRPTVDTGTPGATFSKTGWTKVTGTGATVTYDDTGGRGSQAACIKKTYTDNGSNGDYLNAIYWGDSSEKTSLYASYWMRPDYQGWDGNLKLWRIMSETNVFDTKTLLYCGSDLLHFYKSSTSYWIRRDASKVGVWYLQNTAESLAVDTEWRRAEIYWTKSTADTPDGTIIYNVHSDNTITKIFNWPNWVETHSASLSTNVAKYFFIQDYYGSNNGIDSADKKMYIGADVYIQSGTPARIEIGDAADWNVCTHREIQYPTAWADTSISVTLNRGTFNTGVQLYLFVVNANNVPTAGHPVEFV